MKFDSVMVDMETMATTADAVILSIGAVKFDLESGEINNEGFYASISLDSQHDKKRRFSESTIIWWMKQSEEAQNVFREQKQTLDSALVDFGDWFDNTDALIWSNGADFDIPALAHAYTQFGRETPWKFWNSRCFRTYKNLPGAKNVVVERLGTHHNALQDAIYQAELLVKIHAKLFKGGKVLGKMPKVKA